MSVSCHGIMSRDMTQEHVSGFMLSAFVDPAAAIHWALSLQEDMMSEPW